MTIMNSKERLTNLLGSRLANKLLSELLKANADLQKILLNEVLKAVNSRLKLVGDDLNEKRFEHTREDALDCIRHLMASAALCSTINISCIIAHGQGQSMSAFIAHASEHYEDELATPREDKEDVVTSLREQIEHVEDEDLEHMAKAHSSGN